MQFYIWNKKKRHRKKMKVFFIWNETFAMLYVYSNSLRGLLFCSFFFSFVFCYLPNSSSSNISSGGTFTIGNSSIFCCCFFFLKIPFVDLSVKHQISFKEHIMLYNLSGLNPYIVFNQKIVALKKEFFIKELFIISFFRYLFYFFPKWYTCVTGESFERIFLYKKKQQTLK